MGKDIRNKLGNLWEDGKLEVYFCNKELLGKYIDFIKSHKFFVKEVFIKKKEELK